jgi:hypothetical protein
VDDLAAELADALASGREWDLDGAALPAALLVQVLTAAPPPGAPALRLRQATVTGALRLFGARVAVPVELRECTFRQVPDLRMAEFTGLALTGSQLPGLQAGNLRVGADLLLDDGFDAEGPVDLTDAQVGGSLRLSGGRLRGAGGHALVADRVVVEGTWYARRLRADAELRLPGARITGNADLAGAQLTSPSGDALDVTGITIGGSMLAGRHTAGPAFTASGRVQLPGARIGGDLVFSGAHIVSTTIPDPGEEAPEGSRAPVLPAGIVDPAACLVADRVRVEGNLELDDGLQTTGTVRLPNAVIGGYLRLSGAELSGPSGASDRGIALLADGMDVGGDIEGRDNGRGSFSCAGQLRLVDAHVRGTASLSGCTLAAPDGYALLGDRLRSAGSFICDGHSARARSACRTWTSARRWTARARRSPVRGCGPTRRCAPRSTCAPPRSARTSCASKGSSRPGACGSGWPMCTSPSNSSTRPWAPPSSSPGTPSTRTA